MRDASISRRSFLARSSAVAAVWATPPCLTASATVVRKHPPGNPTTLEANSQPHHVIVPLYRAGKFIEVVSGDPHQVGTPYVMRIPNYDGQIVFPHRHPEDEHITVVQGTWYLGSGESF